MVKFAGSLQFWTMPNVTVVVENECKVVRHVSLVGFWLIPLDANAGPSDFVGSFILNLVLPEIAGIIFFVTWLGAMS